MLSFASVIIKNTLYRPLLLMALATFFSFFAIFAGAEDSLLANSDLEKQRQLYSAAKKALSQRNYQKADQLTAQLQGYPLYPYLRYEQLARQLSRLSQTEFDEFNADFADTPLARRLQNRWLKKLVRQKKWSQFLANYPQHTSSASLKCQQAWALLKTGKKTEAYRQAGKLWVVPHSQNKACDPLFKVWMQDKQLTEDLAWQRFWMALFSRQHSLAKYISSFLSDQDKKNEAQRALALARNPKLLAKQPLAVDASHFSELTAYIIRRLIYQDPELAVNLWQGYEPQLQLSEEATDNIRRRLGLYVLKSYRPDSPELVRKIDPQQKDEQLMEWQLRYQLSQEDWSAVAALLAQLPPDLQQKSRWRYWQARELEHQHKQAEANTLYQTLASERNFYGFLAAQRLGVHFQLNHSQQPINPDTMQTIMALPGIQRARELFHHQELSNARIEWWRATQHFSKLQHYHAGILAQQWGWLSQGISGAISARHWDDMELRFPAPYQQKISAKAADYQIDDQWIFAVARQESAFKSDIRSPAGAIGLMQLMPRTAKQTAKSIKLPYKGSYQLTNPDTNIELGSAYLAKMYQRYKQNRIYATAAYNAGPHRVAGWLKERGDLPVDIWIETIPYDETRQYVQNVLSYAVIYGNKLGKEMEFMTRQERQGLPQLLVP